jgi:hypothetical protein
MRMLHWTFAGAVVVLVICLGLVACGVTSSTTGTSTTGASSTSSTGGCATPAGQPATGVATGVATVVGTVVLQTGTVGSTPAGGGSWPTFPPLPGAVITPGQITVTTDLMRYSTCQNIQVVIANGLLSTIYAADHQTSCSIVTLQEQVGNTWQATGRCLLATATRLYAIDHGTAVAQTLHPGSGSLRSQANGWPAGTYRIAFTSFVGGPQSLHAQPPVYSQTFTIA